MASTPTLAPTSCIFFLFSPKWFVFMFAPLSPPWHRYWYQYICRCWISTSNSTKKSISVSIYNNTFVDIDINIDIELHTDNDINTKTSISIWEYHRQQHSSRYQRSNHHGNRKKYQHHHTISSQRGPRMPKNKKFKQVGHDNQNNTEKQGFRSTFTGGVGLLAGRLSLPPWPLPSPPCSSCCCSCSSPPSSFSSFFWDQARLLHIVLLPSNQITFFLFVLLV